MTIHHKNRVPKMIPKIFLKVTQNQIEDIHHLCHNMSLFYLSYFHLRLEITHFGHQRLDLYRTLLIVRCRLCRIVGGFQLGLPVRKTVLEISLGMKVIQVLQKDRLLQ